VLPAEHDRTTAAAQAILDRGGWCMLEVCVDIPRQIWEPRVLLFDVVARHVADAVAEELACEPGFDARLSGCHRRTLQPDPGLGAYLICLGDAMLNQALPALPGPERSR
jgi:hypothetical protein